MNKAINVNTTLFVCLIHLVCLHVPLKDFFEVIRFDGAFFESFC